MNRSEREAILCSNNPNAKILLEKSSSYQKQLLDTINKWGWNLFLVKPTNDCTPVNGEYILHANSTPYIKGFYVKTSPDFYVKPPVATLCVGGLQISRMEKFHWISRGPDYWEIPFFYEDFIFDIRFCNKVSIRFEGITPILITRTCCSYSDEEMPKADFPQHYILPFPNPLCLVCTNGHYGVSLDDINCTKPFATILQELVQNMHATLTSGKNDWSEFIFHMGNLDDWKKASSMVRPKELIFEQANSLQYKMRIKY